MCYTFRPSRRIWFRSNKSSTRGCKSSSHISGASSRKKAKLLRKGAETGGCSSSTPMTLAPQCSRRDKKSSRILTCGTERKKVWKKRVDLERTGSGSGKTNKGNRQRSHYLEGSEKVGKGSAFMISKSRKGDKKSSRISTCGTSG